MKKTRRKQKFSISTKSFWLPSKWTKKKKVHFVINIAIGILITVFMYILEEQPIGRVVFNYMVDLLIREEHEKQKNKFPDNMIFIDIDNQTNELWNSGDSSVSSLLTKRDKLANLLFTIEQYNPKIIILDMDFTFRSKPPEMDDSITKFFNSFKEKVLSGKSNTKIILPAEFTQNNEMKQSFIDRINQNNPNIYIGSPLIATEINDRSIRYAIDYHITRSKDTIWSIPILAYCVYKGFQGEKLNSEIVEKEFGLKAENEMKNQKFSLNIFSSRIRYALQPPRDFINVDSILTGNMDKGNKSEIDVRYSPMEFTGVKTPNDILNTFQKNKLINSKIVIIGNSSRQKGDIYMTPIGEMAGFYIIGNSLNTLFIGQVHLLGKWWIILIELITIILAAYLFLHIHSVAAEFILLLVLGVPLYLLTIYIFSSYGMLLNVVFIILGIAVHRFVSGFEDMLAEKGKKEHKPNKLIQEKLL